MGVYVSQIESIKKTVKDYEEEITILKTNSREMTDELDRARYKIGGLESDLRSTSETLDIKMT